MSSAETSGSGVAPSRCPLEDSSSPSRIGRAIDASGLMTGGQRAAQRNRRVKRKCLRGLRQRRAPAGQDRRAGRCRDARPRQTRARRVGFLVIGEDVAWRVRCILPDVRPVGPIGVLATRAGARPAERGRCPSCGDSFDARDGGPFGYALRCVPCSLTAKVVAKLGRDGGAWWCAGRIRHARGHLRRHREGRTPHRAHVELHLPAPPHASIRDPGGPRSPSPVQPRRDRALPARAPG